jgi:phospholipase/carboxylesterase
VSGQCDQNLSGLEAFDISSGFNTLLIRMQTDFLQAGMPLKEASAAVLMAHGRGASAADMVSLAQSIIVPGVTYLAPQAPGFAWYPYPFLAPLEQNEPQLSESLSTLGRMIGFLEDSGLPAEKVLLLGFSQGACLSLEYAARNPRRFAGVAGLSGGLIGPPGSDLKHPGSLEGTPIFLGCSDIDPHIPKERVLESERILRGMGAEVTARLYPKMGHMVNEDEIDFVRRMVEQAANGDKIG